MRHTLTLVIHPVRDVMRSRCTPSRWSKKSVRPFAPPPWSGISLPLTAEAKDVAPALVSSFARPGAKLVKVVVEGSVKA